MNWEGSVKTDVSQPEEERSGDIMSRHRTGLPDGREGGIHEKKRVPL